MDFVTTIRADGTIPVPQGLFGHDHLCPGQTVAVSVTTLPEKPSRANALKALAELQRILAEYVPPEVSLADELIEDRRREAAREYLDH